MYSDVAHLNPTDSMLIEVLTSIRKAYRGIFVVGAAVVFKRKTNCNNVVWQYTVVPVQTEHLCMASCFCCYV